MQVINSTKSVWFDVDNTLVFSKEEFPKLRSKQTVLINRRCFLVHSLHVELIKDFKARGHTVVVWSAGGAEWAEIVVRALGLEEEVDVVIGKPDWFCDDKAPEAFLTGRFYYHQLEGNK